MIYIYIYIKDKYTNKLAYITIYSCGLYFEIMLHEADLRYIVFTKATRTICCFPFLCCFKCC